MKGPSPILTPALVALTICVVLGLLALFTGRTRPSATIDHGRVVFRYRMLLRSFVAFASVFLPSGVTFLFLLVNPETLAPSAFVMAGILVVMICVPLSWECAAYYVTFDDEILTQRSAWRGTRSFAWDDVSELTYSTLNMWFILRFENGAKVRVPIFVANLKEFLRRIERHLPADALRESRKGYEKVGRPFPPLRNDPILEARPPR